MRLSHSARSRVRIVDNHGPDLLVDGRAVATGLSLTEMKRLAVQVRRSLGNREAPWRVPEAA